MREGCRDMTIGDVCVNKSSIKRANTCFSPDEKIEYVDISSIDNEDNKVISTTIVEFGDAPSRAQQKIEYGDILVSLVRPNLRNVAVFEKKISNAVASSGFCVLRCKSIVLNRYIFTVVRSKIFVDYLVGRVTGAAYPSVSESNIKDFVIPIPPLEEQERIVAELDLLTGVIEKQKAQLKELDTLAQSIFYDMFEDILTAQPSQSLKDIAEYYIGLTYKPDDISERGTIVLRSSNIQDNSLDFKDIVRVVTNISESKIVKEGDILMCVRNGSARLVGKVARIKNLPEKMSFGAFMTIIRSQYNDFLYYFFLSDFFRSQLKTSKTATINQITSKMLDNIHLNVPDKTIQQQFAEKIEAIEHQKTLIKKSIEETQKLFDYTMDKYFG